MLQLIKSILAIFSIRINIYNYNGVLHAYNNVWFYNGDGGDSYEDVYATAKTIPGLYLRIVWKEIRWSLFDRWEIRVFRMISDTAKVWWYNQLLETECDMFVCLANKIEKYINWNNVDWRLFKEQVI